MCAAARGHGGVQVRAGGDVGTSQPPGRLGRARIRWYGSPSASANTVRSASCRSTTSRSAASSALAVQRAGQPQRDRDVVGRARALQLVDEPQPPLGEGQRQQVAGASPAVSAGRASSEPCQAGGEPGDGRRLEQRPQRHLHTQHRPHPAQQLDRGERVPAQLEEVLVHPDPVASQHLRAQAAQQLFPHGGRGPAGARRAGAGIARGRQDAAAGLFVRAAEKDEVSVRRPPCQVPGAAHPPPGDERAGHGGFLGLVRQARHVHLARDAGRYRFEESVQKVHGVRFRAGKGRGGGAAPLRQQAVALVAVEKVHLAEPEVRGVCGLFHDAGQPHGEPGDGALVEQVRRAGQGAVEPGGLSPLVEGVLDGHFQVELGSRRPGRDSSRPQPRQSSVAPGAGRAGREHHLEQRVPGERARPG